MHRSRLDSRLSSFVLEEDPLEQERLLTEILSVEAMPIIARVLRQQLGLYSNGSGRWGDSEVGVDLTSEILARLVDRLRRLRSGDDNDSKSEISDFSSYVSRIARNVCYDYLREKYPTRHHLKSRIRYLLNVKSRFSIWKLSDLTHLCGLAEWGGSGTSTGRLFDGDLVERVRRRTTSSPIGSPATLITVLEALFLEHGAPIEIDKLVTLVIQIVGSSETVIESLDTTLQEIHSSLPDHRPRADQNLEDHERLRSLWNEILKLPLLHRKLILLSNLDVAGNDLWSLFIETGIVLPSNILDALGLSHQDFVALWPRVPLNLTELADHLGLTREQVVRSRFQARERLKKCLHNRNLNKNRGA